MALPTAPFNAANSIYAGKKVIQTVLDSHSTTAATAVSGSAPITSAGHNFIVGDLVNFFSGTGFTGLVVGTNYYVVAVATDTFSLSATAGGTAISPSADGSAGVFSHVEVFESNNVKQGGNKTFEYFKRYGDDGISREQSGGVPSEAEDKINWECDEVKRLLDIFDGQLDGLAVAKSVTCWVKDPRDASGKVALKSSAFPANITRPGELNLEKKVIATLEAKSTGNSAITYTRDASVS